MSRTLSSSKGNVGFLWKCCSEKGLLKRAGEIFIVCLELWLKRRVPVELCVDVAYRSCLLREVKSPLLFRGAPQDSSRIAAGMNRASSRVEAGTSGFFSISDFDPSVSADWNTRVRPLFVLRNGTPLASGFLHRVTDHFSSCIWNLHLFVDNAMGVSFPLVL